MRIQHNILAMNAYRNYNTNTSALAKNLEKLSSGYKINRAGDDAAGLAISEKMRAQITGLNAAQKNVKDGISLVKTAEGAMQEIQDMLNRMDYLATQSANGTYDDPVDRLNLQKEVEALKTEINRIADSANFNGINLLDGSLTDGVSKDLVGAKTDIPILQEAATDPTKEVGTKTVLHENATKEGKTSFEVELHTTGLKGTAGDKLKVTIGDTELEFTVDDANGVNQLKSGAINSEDLATKIVALFNNTTNGADGKINGQAFTVRADGNKILFEQTAVPANKGEVVDADLEVKIDFTVADTSKAKFDAPDSGISAKYVTVKNAIWTPGKEKVDTTAAGALGTAAGTGNTVTSSLDIDKIMAAINKKDPEIGNAANAVTGSTAVQVKKGAANLELQVNGVTIATAGEVGEAVTKGGKKTYTFTDDDGNELGTITLDAAGAAIAANALDGGVNTGLEVTMGKKADTTEGDALAEALNNAGAGDGDVKVQYKDDKYVISVGKVSIEAASSSIANGVLTLKDADGNILMTMDSHDANTKELGFQEGLTEATDVGLNFVAATSSADGTWNVHTTNNKQGAPAFAGNLASTKFDLKADLISDGSTITIGEETYIFKVGADSTVTAGKGQTLIDLSKSNEKDLIRDAGQLLSQQTAGNKAFTIGFNEDENTISLHEKEGQTVYTKGELNTVAGFDALVYANKTGKTVDGKALTLQIGDTSDDFNQMKLSVGDMHTVAMGIDGIDISNQEGAKAAVQVVKDAINYVSGVRGDLGAVQNRLEHTANNLSVMAENIQDAESTIRDTDIAEEMMAYTKNNILIQSAQAMLAQANAVPQGVLQLLG